MSKNKLMYVAPVLIGIVAAAGCNLGMQPAGASPEEVKSTIAKMKPEDQIKFYESSPMPAAQKAAKIAEIKAKYGITGDTPAPAPGRPPTP